ncbi:MAG: bifunctional diguanylate cyclase/phosphodiesterase [Chiayiivirga sp.]|jgi:diguanylate cyclase (GGDEF)-like protein|uniref:putative bifunctional diguanylate cyclase/phosphodiesterase n=1 Tax=Chiayiivirga sp. TaxID=2041042 RepID=UPI0025C63273|nr:bifunctional diguanylate cyclase/phosphodiesterase [Chiayiivirga sp.]MCI1709952.1 bifunctional diguanylate cyclase/phosphodiesterase [Chiayiivirga sp.]MCI1730375.1 bifunctional diguanylate cyclase/phosphodiesterase [Chiayiivirga sp.]
MEFRADVEHSAGGTRFASRAAALAVLDDRIALSLEQGTLLGVLVVRLLRLREFNILFGYELGQHLVEKAQQAIARVLRPADTVEQVGEGEFLLCLPELISANHALLAAHRVVRVFNEPLVVEGSAMLAAVAVGAALCPEHGSSADLLSRRADVAFGEARRSGTHAALYQAREEHFDLPYGALRAALEQGQLQLYLQPIADPRDARVAGAEALARWNSPELGTISPDVFIPLAERTGLINELTRWCINATLRHAAETHLAERGIHLSINLSPRVFLDNSFADQLLSALKLWGVPPRTLMLEVTESAMMEDAAQAIEVLLRLRAAGMRVAIDDFGTGYASFSYLRRLPVDEVKLDRSFVRDITTDARGAQLVRSMIELAHSLEIRVVAEGVEDNATLAMLADMGCDFAQGYHIGRPMPAKAFTDALPGQEATR